MKQKNILAVYGIPDNNSVRITLNEGVANKLHPAFKGTNIIAQLLDKNEFKIQNLVLGGEKENIQLQTSKPDLIYNAMCNYDVQKRSLKSFEEKFGNLNITILNHPDGIKKSTRDAIYNQFKTNQAFIVPKTVRVRPKSSKNVLELAEENNINFPFILRTIGENNSREITKLDSKEDIDNLEQFAYDGSEFYLIQYHEYKSSDEIYRKGRLLVISGEVIPRHLLFSKNWMVEYYGNEELLKEKCELSSEEEILLTSEVSSELVNVGKEIFNYTKLDYFGVDYGINSDGKVIVFEANACMIPYISLEYGKEYLKNNAKYINKQLNKMFNSKGENNVKNK